MKQKSPNLFQLTKTAGQKEFLIKLTLFTFITAFAITAFFLELEFRKNVILEGVIHRCWYEGYDVSCNYLKTSTGNFLLTEGTIEKVLQTAPTTSLYDKKVRLSGRLSRQKLSIRQLGLIPRFQIEKIEFLEP